MVTKAQSTANWRNMHTHMDRVHLLTHLHQHSYNQVARSASSAITEFGIELELACLETVLFKAMI